MIRFLEYTAIFLLLLMLWVFPEGFIPHLLCLLP